MTTNRGEHTATLLEGRVLVAGGFDDAHLGVIPLASAEVFDPTTGTFRPTGPMAMARGHHTATLLGDGRVLIAGGEDDWNSYTPFATAELFQ